MRQYLTANDIAGRYPGSWYVASTDFDPPRPPLDGDVRVPVCVVGAGYTGLSTALHLAEAGMEVMVVEANRVGWGASGRNGGQLGSGQRRSQRELERMLGKDHARMLWDIAEEAKELVRERIEKHSINCQLDRGVVHAAHRKRHLMPLYREADHLRRVYQYEHLRMLHLEWLRAFVPAREYYGGVLDLGAGHLHPLRLAVGLARAAEKAGARIVEGTVATGVDLESEQPLVRTESGNIQCEHLVLACNGYLDGLEPGLAERILPINNYIVATEPLSETMEKRVLRDSIAVADTRSVVNYYRLTPDKRLLFGGGEGYVARFPRDIGKYVRRIMLRTFPQLSGARIDYAWGGTLALTLNRMPVFARPASNVLAACGYSGHGVAMACWAGKAIAQAVAGNAGRFDAMEKVPTPRLIGGARYGGALLQLALMWHALRDRM